MEFTRINLMLPTYKRVLNGKLIKFLTSANNTATCPEDIHLSILLNRSDKESLDFFRTFCMKTFDTEFFFIADGPADLGKFYNKLYTETASYGENTLVSMVGDDMVFITEGWDEAILKKANEVGGKGIIYCDDDYVQHEKLCVNLFTSRQFVDATGMPFMPPFPGDYIDDYWMCITGQVGGHHYLKDVIIKHEHAGSLKEIDEATYRKLQNATTQNDAEFLLPRLVAEAVENLRKVYS